MPRALVAIIAPMSGLKHEHKMGRKKAVRPTTTVTVTVNYNCSIKCRSVTHAVCSLIRLHEAQSMSWIHPTPSVMS